MLLLGTDDLVLQVGVLCITLILIIWLLDLFSLRLPLGCLLVWGRRVVAVLFYVLNMVDFCLCWLFISLDTSV